MDRKGVKFEGKVALAGRLDDRLVLRVHPRARPGETNSNSPSYEVFIVKNGRELCCGASWIKYSESVGEFLSITLDQVDWPQPLNLAVFPPQNKDDHDWPVVWSRPRGTRVQDEPTSESANE